MKNVSILEADDEIHPDDWTRPLLRSADFESHSDAWHETSTYGGGPMDHLKWVPCWLTLGSVWWGKTYREYFEKSRLPHEFLRGDIPDNHKFPLAVHGWDRRHPLWWEQWEKTKRELEAKTLPFGKHRGKPVGFVQQRDPDYFSWLASEMIPSWSGLAKQLLETNDSLKIYYHPEYRKWRRK